MQFVRVLLIASACIGLYNTAVAQTPEKKKWVCTVPSGITLISFYYAGGDWVQIHIAPYGKSGNYPVTKSNGVATGTTSNGTPITCKQE